MSGHLLGSASYQQPGSLLSLSPDAAEGEKPPQCPPGPPDDGASLPWGQGLQDRGPVSGGGRNAASQRLGRQWASPCHCLRPTEIFLDKAGLGTDSLHACCIGFLCGLAIEMQASIFASLGGALRRGSLCPSSRGSLTRQPAGSASLSCRGRHNALSGSLSSSPAASLSGTSSYSHFCSNWST